MSEGALDPVRQRLIDGLLRRAERLDPAARALVEARIAALRAAPPLPALPPRSPTLRSPGPLAALRARLDGDEAASAVAPGAASAPAELKTVRRYRRTWTRLGAEQRLVQALAEVPPQAGPLNTPRLLHQALCLMRDTAPEYLQHLATQLEALLWLEQAGGLGSTPRPRGSGALRR
ncbi:DUF2894 domain-containing protein [Ideonella sp. 4Y16]|uniref:DUF2894 domain-containing protein n=1 Tax=Ideonella alba TaxID=2824118 RepID=UPI001B360F39|nr:DUF2894 domain-containing protein [Ideonella alba]MBQ0944305.1 DUF2894 domain-containing protein [Ideonella alba]